MAGLRVVVSTLLLATGAAHASANVYLERAERLYHQQRFSEAHAQLEIARKVPAHTEAQDVHILDLLARCSIAEGRPAQAEESYLELLRHNPQWRPEPGTSPKIVDVFQRAKERMPAAVAPPRAEASPAAPLASRDTSPAARPTNTPTTQPSTVPSEASLGPPAAPQEALTPPAQGGVTQTASSSAFHMPRAAGWALLGLGVGAGIAAGVLQATSHNTAARAQASAWADTASNLHAQAVGQAQWALGLAIGAGASAAAGGAILLVW
jgi:hypothetical protein